MDEVPVEGVPKSGAGGFRPALVRRLERARGRSSSGFRAGSLPVPRREPGTSAGPG